MPTPATTKRKRARKRKPSPNVNPVFVDLREWKATQVACEIAMRKRVACLGPLEPPHQMWSSDPGNRVCGRCAAAQKRLARLMCESVSSHGEG